MKCKCRFCGHRWIARVKKPVACAACKRYFWDKPQEKERDSAPTVEVAAQSIETK